MITGGQILRARELLGWTRSQLAQRVKTVSANTVARAESDLPIAALQFQAIQRALEVAGLEFANDRSLGVRLTAARSIRQKSRTVLGSGVRRAVPGGFSGAG